MQRCHGSLLLVEGWVLVVEPSRPVRKALATVLERRGYSVVPTSGMTEASRIPRRFDCGIFADRLNDGNAVSFAGWLLVEQRIRCAVFFGATEDVDFRLRASNLGTYVSRHEGLHRLERAVADAVRETALAAGGELVSLRANGQADSGVHRRR